MSFTPVATGQGKFEGPFMPCLSASAMPASEGRLLYREVVPLSHIEQKFHSRTTGPTFREVIAYVNRTQD